MSSQNDDFKSMHFVVRSNQNNAHNYKKRNEAIHWDFFISSLFIPHDEMITAIGLYQNVSFKSNTVKQKWRASVNLCKHISSDILNLCPVPYGHVDICVMSERDCVSTWAWQSVHTWACHMWTTHVSRDFIKALLERLQQCFKGALRRCWIYW